MPESTVSGLTAPSPAAAGTTAGTTPDGHGGGPVVAAVDLGSNSIKLTVGRPDGAEGVEALATASETVRLGAGVAATGRLADDRIEAALVALVRFAKVARKHGATRLVGVATEATRRAANGAAFLDRVRAETGWEIRPISGDEEAALTFRGLAATTDLAGSVVVADIGGGSTEVIVARDGAIGDARSLPLGSGSLTDRLVVSDPPTAAEVAACQAAAAEAIAPLPLPPGAEARLVVVGGTGEYLARLVPDPHAVDAAAVAAVLGLLERMPVAEVAATVGIPEARARVLPAGIAVVLALADRLNPTRVEVARSGIRTGLLLDAFAGRR